MKNKNLMNMKCFDFHCQGESHKAARKVCQDYSYSHSNENGDVVAIVCDGHGGERYFRSDVGAKLATKITSENVEFFLEHVDKSLFVGLPYSSCPARQFAINPIDKIFRQLFSSVISCWKIAISDHAQNTPISEYEKEHVGQKYLAEFSQGGCLEKTYGCTLIAYVQTSRFWFAFQIGDGKCISFDFDGNSKEPIPWDDRCFLNETTSMCDIGALDNFRYCYCGDGTFPVAVFLGSDGVDVSFGEEHNLVNFYTNVINHLATKGLLEVESEIVEDLPELSRRGSKDDMSLAFVYDENGVSHVYDLWNNDRIKDVVPVQDVTPEIAMEQGPSRVDEEVVKGVDSQKPIVCVEPIDVVPNTTEDHSGGIKPQCGVFVAVVRILKRLRLLFLNVKGLIDYVRRKNKT